MARKVPLIPGKLRDPSAPKLGRPSNEDRQARQIEDILVRVSGGETLDRVCQGEDMPTPATFRSWTYRDPALRKLWREARNEHAHALFDRMVDLADQLATGEFDRDSTAKVTAIRGAIDALKHATARLLPSDYGEQKPGAQGISVTIVTSLPMGPGSVPEQAIDTAFKVVGKLPVIEQKDG